MTTAFNAEKNRKALLYTAIICGGLLLLFILISWKVMPPTIPVPQDLIEINLGNNEDGFGEVQPLVKGNPSAEKDIQPEPKPAAVKQEDAAEEVKPDDNAEENAAPVTKVEKKIPKVKTPVPAVPVVKPVPKPQRPKITMPGGNLKTPGNNPNEDNGYKNQGPGKGPGDNGVPTGNKDSYGHTPGARVEKAKAVVNSFNYRFTGDLQKATINALIRVSPAGVGTFVKIIPSGSTSTNKDYGLAIANYLKSMHFEKADEEYSFSVLFNFKVSSN